MASQGTVIDTLTLIEHQIADFTDIAIGLKDKTMAALKELGVVAQASVAVLSGVSYNANTSGIPTTYNPQAVAIEPNFAGLAPTEPVLPSSDSALISDSAFDSIYTRASDKLAMQHATEDFEAVNRAAAMGIGLPTPTLMSAMSKARQNNLERVSGLVVEQAAQEATFKREDVKTILGLQIQQYQNAWQGINTYLNAESGRLQARVDSMKANLAAEAERRGWSELQMKSALEQADAHTKYAVEIAKSITDLNQRLSTEVAQMTVGLTQAMFAASHYSLGGTINSGVSVSVVE